MTPGFLHFDVRLALTADMLNGAMANLLGDVSCVRKAFDAVGLTDISFRVGQKEARGIKGTVVHFYVGDTLLTLESFDQQKTAGERSSHPHELIRAFLSGEEVSLEKLSQFFAHHKLKPGVSAIAIKILEQLLTPAFPQHTIKGGEALWLVCQLLMLVVQTDALDPKFISVSKLFIGHHNAKSATNALNDPTWLNQVSMMMPITELFLDASVDVLAIAFIKTLAGQIGARGESCIIKVGIGHGSTGFIEALWCEASLPDSIKECGPSNKIKVSALHEITGFTKATCDMAHLSSSLSVHGARNITWQLVYGEKNQAYMQVRFVCSDEDKKEAILAFLVKGEAIEVVQKTIEHHQLNRRLVSVPLGYGNKTISVRFHEYIYYDKTVRVEPLAEDLDAYVQKTDYSVDVARSDLLMAWKKWRGRVALDASAQESQANN